MTNCPIEPGDNAGKRFEEIIDRLFWNDEDVDDECDEEDQEED